jgi:PAS domain S-box-containing protein
MSTGLPIRDRSYEELVHAIDGIVWEVDVPTFRFTYVSPRAEKLLGYPIERWLNEPNFWPNHLHPEDRDWALEFCMRATVAGQDHQFEYRFFAADGRTVWIRDLVTVTREAGQPAKLRGVMLDISERKRADDLLRHSDEMRRRVLEALPAGVMFFAPDGAVMQANAEAQRVLGLTWEEMARRYIRDWDPETIGEDGKPFPAADYPVSHCLRTGQPYPGTVIGVRRPDGMVSWAVFSAVPLLDASTRCPSGAVVTFIDITRRVHTEEKLRESEELHRVICELTSDYAYTCTINSAGLIRMASVTSGFTRVTGYTLAEIQVCGDWAALIHPDDLPLAVARQEAILAGHRGVNELRILTKDRAVRWIRYSTHPVKGADGRVNRLIGAVQDITEHKEAELKLQEYAQGMRALSHRLLDVQETERRHLARELHDEIGQLLTGLRYTLEMAGRVPVDQRQGQLTEAQRLVRELQARVRALSLDLRPTVLDDLGLRPALLSLFQQYTARTGVRVALEHHGLEERLPPAVETATYRIVQEALTNIARHSGAREALVRLRRDEEGLELLVEDRGRGFDARRALAAGTTGGLSGMTERAQLLGGCLRILSAPGGGTCISAELPLPRAEEETAHELDPVPR